MEKWQTYSSAKVNCNYVSDPAFTWGKPNNGGRCTCLLREEACVVKYDTMMSQGRNTWKNQYGPTYMYVITSKRHEYQHHVGSNYKFTTVLCFCIELLVDEKCLKYWKCENNPYDKHHIAVIFECVPPRFPTTTIITVPHSWIIHPSIITSNTIALYHYSSATGMHARISDSSAGEQVSNHRIPCQFVSLPVTAQGSIFTCNTSTRRHGSDTRLYCALLCIGWSFHSREMWHWLSADVMYVWESRTESWRDFPQLRDLCGFTNSL